MIVFELAPCFLNSKSICFINHYYVLKILKFNIEENPPVKGIDPDSNWTTQSNANEIKRATKKNHKKMNYLLINNC